MKARLARSLWLLIGFVIHTHLSAAEAPHIYGIHDHDPDPSEYLNHIKNGVGGGWVAALGFGEAHIRPGVDAAPSRFLF